MCKNTFCLPQKQNLHNFKLIYQENYQKMYCIAIKMVHDEGLVPDISRSVYLLLRNGKVGTFGLTPKKLAVSYTNN